MTVFSSSQAQIAMANIAGKISSDSFIKKYAATIEATYTKAQETLYSIARL